MPRWHCQCGKAHNAKKTELDHPYSLDTLFSSVKCFSVKQVSFRYFNTESNAQQQVSETIPPICFLLHPQPLFLYTLYVNMASCSAAQQSRGTLGVSCAPRVSPSLGRVHFTPALQCARTQRAPRRCLRVFSQQQTEPSGKPSVGVTSSSGNLLSLVRESCYRFLGVSV